ncbi:phage tail tube protein [Bacillus cereus group sp. MYBK12-2]|uniref:phage tail tube protein n=1 Tax=Bacillus cereus group sp. MYBK12-2 TaxID=3450689 RepID=UPI0033011704|nr:hypothetical protein [Bacillus pacificus]HDR7653582.1 hypothetical protein [Bacillus pacificus]
MPVGQGYAGVAKESTFGTAVAVNNYIPVKSIEAAQDPQNYYPEAIRSNRAKVSGIPMGLKNELKVEADAEPNSLGFLLMGALGSVTTTTPDSTNAPTARQHVFLPANTLPTYTWEKYDSVMIQTLAGCKLNSLTLAIEAGGDGVLTAEAEYVVKSITDKASASTPSYTDKNPFVFHRVAVEKGGVVNTNIKSLEFEINNNLKDDQYFLNQSREVGAIDEGMREVKVSGEMRFTNKAEYTKFANGANEGFKITFDGDVLGGTTKEKLVLEIPKVMYDSFEVPMGGPDDEVTGSFEATALFDNTTGAEIKATLVNTVTAF